MFQIILLEQRVKEKGFGPIGFGFSAQNLFLVRYRCNRKFTLKAGSQTPGKTLMQSELFRIPLENILYQEYLGTKLCQ